MSSKSLSSGRRTTGCLSTCGAFTTNQRLGWYALVAYRPVELSPQTKSLDDIHFVSYCRHLHSIQAKIHIRSCLVFLPTDEGFSQTIAEITQINSRMAPCRLFIPWLIAETIQVWSVILMVQTVFLPIWLATIPFDHPLLETTQSTVSRTGDCHIKTQKKPHGRLFLPYLLALKLMDSSWFLDLWDQARSGSFRQTNMGHLQEDNSGILGEDLADSDILRQDLEFPGRISTTTLHDLWRAQEPRNICTEGSLSISIRQSLSLPLCIYIPLSSLCRSMSLSPSLRASEWNRFALWALPGEQQHLTILPPPSPATNVQKQRLFLLSFLCLRLSFLLDWSWHSVRDLEMFSKQVFCNWNVLQQGASLACPMSTTPWWCPRRSHTPPAAWAGRWPKSRSLPPKVMYCWKKSHGSNQAYDLSQNDSSCSINFTRLILKKFGCCYRNCNFDFQILFVVYAWQHIVMPFDNLKAQLARNCGTETKPLEGIMAPENESKAILVYVIFTFRYPKWIVQKIRCCNLIVLGQMVSQRQSLASHMKISTKKHVWKRPQGPEYLPPKVGQALLHSPHLGQTEHNKQENKTKQETATISFFPSLAASSAFHMCLWRFRHRRKIRNMKQKCNSSGFRILAQPHELQRHQKRHIRKRQKTWTSRVQEVVTVRQLLSSGVHKHPKHTFYCVLVQSGRGGWSVTDLCWLLEKPWFPGLLSFSEHSGENCRHIMACPCLPSARAIELQSKIQSSFFTPCTLAFSPVQSSQSKPGNTQNKSTRLRVKMSHGDQILIPTPNPRIPS